jgi:hypothetical protein
MKHSRTVQMLFEESPLSWGLRGDPYLWKHMAECVSADEWPPTEEAFFARLEGLFRELTGADLSSEDYFIKLQQYAHGGMSSGMVSPEYWRETAIPCLMERYRSSVD